MAVVNLKSGPITNRDSTPEVLTNAAINQGEIREAVGVIAIGTADSATSNYRFCSIPSNARVSSVKLWSDAALGAATAPTLDLWDTTANGAAVVKAGFFSAAVDLHTAAVTAVDATHTTSGAATHLVSAGEQSVWKALGLTSDPSKFYDIVLTSTVNNTTTGANVVLKCQFAI